MTTADDPGRLARDAYTYGHLPIVAGIIATAVGLKLLIAAPDRPFHPVGLAMALGGPVLYLLGQSGYRRRISRTHDVKGIAVAGILLLLAPIAHGLSALFVSALVAALLTFLAVWESQVGNRRALARSALRDPGRGTRRL